MGNNLSMIYNGAMNMWSRGPILWFPTTKEEKERFRDLSIPPEDNYDSDE